MARLNLGRSRNCGNLFPTHAISSGEAHAKGESVGQNQPSWPGYVKCPEVLRSAMKIAHKSMTAPAIADIKSTASPAKK